MSCAGCGCARCLAHVRPLARPGLPWSRAPAAPPSVSARLGGGSAAVVAIAVAAMAFALGAAGAPRRGPRWRACSSPRPRTRPAAAHRRGPRSATRGVLAERRPAAAARDRDLQGCASSCSASATRASTMPARSSRPRARCRASAPVPGRPRSAPRSASRASASSPRRPTLARCCGARASPSPARRSCAAVAIRVVPGGVRQSGAEADATLRAAELHHPRRARTTAAVNGAAHLARWPRAAPPRRRSATAGQYGATIVVATPVGEVADCSMPTPTAPRRLRHADLPALAGARGALRSAATPASPASLALAGAAGRATARRGALARGDPVGRGARGRTDRGRCAGARRWRTCAATSPT